VENYGLVSRPQFSTPLNFLLGIMSLMKKSTIIITLALTVIGGLLVNWLTPINIPGYIWSFLSSVVRLFFVKIPLPVWAIIVLIFFIPMVNLLIRKKQDHHNVNKVDASEPDFLKYTSGNFFGIDWNWGYRGNRIDRNSVTARCPKCKCLLDWVRESSFKIIEDITLICPHCNFLKEFKLNEKGIIRRVEQEIDRTIVAKEISITQQADEL